MTDLLKRLAVLITGDAKGAVTAAEQTAASMEKAAIAEANLSVKSAQLAVSQARLAGDTDALTAAQERLAATKLEAAVTKDAAAVSAAERNLAKYGQTANASKGILDKVGVSGATAGAALAAGAIKFGLDEVQAYADATAAVRGFQRVSGASAEDASKLTAAFKVLGIDTDTAGTAVFRLAHNLDGNKEKLAALGVEVAHTADGAVDLTNTFLNVADAVAAAGSGAKADQIAFAAFGRGATALLPVLLRGRQGLQELFTEADRHHQIFSQADLEKGRQFTLATKELTQAFEGLKIEAGNSLIPLATGLAKGAEGTISFLDKITPYTQKLQVLTNPLGVLISKLPLTKKHTDDLAASAKEAAKAAQMQAEAEQADAEALSKADSAMTGLISAANGYRDSTDAIASAEQGVADAHAEVAKKAADVASATRDARSADEDLASAQRDLNTARREAPLELARASTDATLAAHDEAKAVRDLADARRKWGSENQKTLDAEDAVTKAHQGSIDAADKLKALQDAGDHPESVLDAENKVADAKQRQADAAASLTKANQENPAADIAAAEKKVTDAKDAQLLDQYKLGQALEAYNKLNGTNLGVQDAINGKIQETIDKQLIVLNNQAQIAANQAAADGAAATTNDANRAAVVLGGASGPTGNQTQAASDAAKTAATKALGGRGDPANPLVQANTGPQIIQTNHFHGVTTAPQIAAAVRDELTFLGRAN